MVRIRRGKNIDGDNNNNVHEEEKGKKRERDISTQASCPSRINAPFSLEPKKHLHPQQLNAFGLHP